MVARSRHTGIALTRETAERNTDSGPREHTEKHRLWTQRKPMENLRKIKQTPPENQRNTETLENPRVFLSLEVACRSYSMGAFLAILNTKNAWKQNQITACGGCCNCLNIAPSVKSSNTPYLYKSCSDSTQPYGYETSDLKEMYLSREQLNRKRQMPSLTEQEYIQMNDPHSSAKK